MTFAATNIIVEIKVLQQVAGLMLLCEVLLRQAERVKPKIYQQRVTTTRRRCKNKEEMLLKLIRDAFS